MTTATLNPLAHRTAHKMNGLGNEIVVLDLRDDGHGVSAAEARAIGRAPGLHFDQLMVLERPRQAGTAAYVRIFNIDGSEAGACGNGTRCVGWLLLGAGEGEAAGAATAIETQAGVLAIERPAPWHYAVDMGRPGLGWRDIPLSAAVADTARVPVPLDAATRARAGEAFPTWAAMASMGNPHAIFLVDDVAAHDLAGFGPALEHHPLFPERANISLVSVTSPEAIVQRVWERGVGLTLACGSGACAAVVSTARLGLTGRRVRVSLPGGDLTIHWREDDRVIMTGPVELERQVTLDPAIFAEAA
jgi:diaminopimelate epimerase